MDKKFFKKSWENSDSKHITDKFKYFIHVPVIILWTILLLQTFLFLFRVKCFFSYSKISGYLIYSKNDEFLPQYFFLCELIHFVNLLKQAVISKVWWDFFDFRIFWSSVKVIYFYLNTIFVGTSIILKLTSSMTS